MLLLMLSSMSIANDDDGVESIENPSFWMHQSSHQQPMSRLDWQRKLPWHSELNKHRNSQTPAMQMFGPEEIADHIPPPMPSFLEDDVDISDDDSEYGDDLESTNPYGISNVRSISETRKSSRRGRTYFQSLCPHKRRQVKLGGHSVFQYRPDQYDEVECNVPYSSGLEYETSSNKVHFKFIYICKCNVMLPVINFRHSLIHWTLCYKYIFCLFVITIIL